MAIRKRFRTRAHPMGDLYLDGRRVQVLLSRVHPKTKREQFLVESKGRAQKWVDADLFAKTPDAGKRPAPAPGVVDPANFQHNRPKPAKAERVSPYDLDRAEVSG